VFRLRAAALAATRNSFEPRVRQKLSELEGSAGPVAGFITVPGAPDRPRGEAANTAAALQRTAFIAKYPPTTPMIIRRIVRADLFDSSDGQHGSKRWPVLRRAYGSRGLEGHPVYR
jgi:hypothetical protein